MRRSFGVLGGIVLAAALSQFPEYAQQYTQRLGGAVDELKAITAKFDSDATAAGLTRDQALARYESSPDSFLSGQGHSIEQDFARYQLLSATLQRIEGADAWERLRDFPSYFDSDIGHRTLDDFKPAIPVTEEGLLYAAVGLILGYMIATAFYSLLMLPFRLLWRRMGWEWMRI